LPYGLKIQIPEFKSPNENILKSIKPYQNELTGFFIGNCISEEFKPILRPLSDLKNEDLYSLGLQRKTRGVKNWGDIWFDGAVTLEDMEFVLSKLYEGHFDVYGLIEQGLAIDINTVDVAEC